MNLDNHISTLGLNNRAINALIFHGIRENGKLIKKPIDSIEKLISLTENELSSIVNLGKKSKNHIKNQLNLHGLNLKNSYIKSTPVKPILFAKNMDLKDYFAAKAMQGFCANISRDLTLNIEFFTRTAYKVADAMMEARNE